MPSYANWVEPNKTSGNGDDTVSWAAQPHTGRTARQTTGTFSASGVESKVLTIIQSGKTEFVTIDPTAAVAKGGGSVTISGTSNSSKLTFSLTGQNNIGLTLPSSYLANSVSTNNGAAITGDPGATAEYAFTITFTGINENTSISSLTSQLTVTPNSGTAAVCNITQAAGDAYLTISPTEITIPAAGTAQSVTVTSNTSWSIS
ncbi:MAG: BACON domain-containing protein [Bacteroidaceae bacterium]|nr:BACON domain-containing protein [Bacteroidaceae bacterium]